MGAAVGRTAGRSKKLGGVRSNESVDEEDEEEVCGCCYRVNMDAMCCVALPFVCGSEWLSRSTNP